MSQPLLPVEIVDQIVRQISNDGNASGVYSRLSTLRNCRSICHTMNDIVLPHLYRHAPFNGPHSFAKFLDELKAHPHRGQFVRTLDFSAFTSVGLGRSRSCNTKMFFLTASTLNECLKLCPNVEEVFLAESLELDIDVDVFRTLFIELKHLKALDFCASDAPEFVQAFQSFLHSEPSWTSSVSNLSFHNCSTLPTSFFEALLPHFDNLQRLDLYNTQVNGTALLRLASSCRLSGLNLGQCTRVSANALVSFITSHPASATLKQLQLLYSWNKTHPLSTVPQALDIFVQALPRQLEILDLSGCELDLQHLAFLPPNLIELGVHDIDIGEHYSDAMAGEVSDALTTALPQLRYLLLTQNVISSETKFAAILVRLFPNLAIIESPGFSRLPYLNSLSYARISGIGRRDWIARKGFGDAGVEKSGPQYHPRKTNMSLSLGAPRGIYDYYSYRV